MDKLSHIKTWVFDLDGTLYPASSHIHGASDKLLTEYVARLLGASLEEAKEARKKYCEAHGTTLRGLMHEHKVDIGDFMRYTHDIDITPLPQCAVTQKSLDLLEGRKFIFTNAPGIWAERLLNHLDIRNHFEAVFTIEDAEYWPKPHARTYGAFLKKFDIDPKTACMFEDLQENLKPAHDLGMTTVWLHGGKALPQPHVHYSDVTLADWFSAMMKGKQAP